MSKIWVLEKNIKIIVIVHKNADDKMKKNFSSRLRSILLSSLEIVTIKITNPL